MHGFLLILILSKYSYFFFWNRFWMTILMKFGSYNFHIMGNIWPLHPRISQQLYGRYLYLEKNYCLYVHIFLVHFLSVLKYYCYRAFDVLDLFKLDFLAKSFSLGKRCALGIIDVLCLQFLLMLCNS